MTHVLSSLSLSTLAKPKIGFHTLNTIFALSVATYAVSVSPYTGWLRSPTSFKSESAEDIARLKTLCAEAFSAIYVQALNPSSAMRQGGYAPPSLPLTSHLHSLHLRIQATPSSPYVPDKDVSVFPHTQNPSPLREVYSTKGGSKPEFPSPEGTPPGFDLSSAENLSNFSADSTLASPHLALPSASSSKRSVSSVNHSLSESHPLPTSSEPTTPSLPLKEAPSAVNSLSPEEEPLETPTFLILKLVHSLNLFESISPLSAPVTLAYDHEETAPTFPSLPQVRGENEPPLKTARTLFSQAQHTGTIPLKGTNPFLSASPSPDENELLPWNVYMLRVRSPNPLIRLWLMKLAPGSKVAREEIPFRKALIETILSDEFQNFITPFWGSRNGGKELSEKRRDFLYAFLKRVDWGRTPFKQLFRTQWHEAAGDFHGVDLEAFHYGYNFLRSIGIDDAYYDEDINRH